MSAQLIIIRGPLGVGKTTIAKIIAQQVNGAYFAVDQILEAHNWDQAENGRGIPLKNFLQVNAYVVPQIKAEQEKGRSVIVDGNFYYKEQLTNLLQNVGGSHIVFTLKASLKTCLARDNERQDPHGPDAAKAVYAMVSAFDYGTSIETDDVDSSETVDEVLNCLNTY